ncbi:MAG: hypothetical protein JW768_08275 [Chitinispirillaceae bacterium]|nr:hypothetical protein [Chitinispirillaceae bacterium]
MNAPYTKPSGQAHKIQVQSALIYALWACGRAWADSDAPFIVKTALVGNGAEVKIKLVNSSGKTLAKTSEKIHSNYLRAAIPIPSNVKLGDMLLLEVELPKHRLSVESNQVPAGPSLKPKSMKWSSKETKRGYLLKLQAQFVDLPDNTEAEVTIYEYDKDGSHDPLITLPTVIKNSTLDLSWEYQYHDGTDQIPTQNDLKPYQKNYRQPQYFYVIEIDGCRIGTKQESGLVKFNDAIALSLVDPDGTPRANETYKITLPDGTEKKGTLDANGKATIEMPPGPFTVEYGV